MVLPGAIAGIILPYICQKQMRRLYPLIILLVVFINTHAQGDPQAKKLLDQVKAMYTSGTSILASTEIIITDKQGKKLSTSTATLKLKKDKYAVLTTEREIYCNGSDGWVYNIPGNEVTVGPCVQLNAVFQLQFLYSTDYEKDFSYKLNGSKSVGGTKYSEVELTPATKNTTISRMFLYIKGNGLISSFKVTGKDGLMTAYNFPMIKTSTLPDSDFIFDPAKHPGIKIILSRLPRPVLVRPKPVIRPS